MKKLPHSLAAASIALLASFGLASGQPIVPQVQSIGPTDLFQDVVGGQAQMGNTYAPALMLGAYSQSLSGGNSENTIVGGDFGINLFQDGTSVASISTTPTYVADQWAAFSGTSTTLTGSQQTGAADITLAYAGSLRIARTGTGVLQSCVAQEIDSANSTRYQGQTAEFDFHALAGAGFSSATSSLSVIIVQGTGTNDGMTNLAHSINTALGGSNWTGVALTTNTVPITTIWNRYAVLAAIASTTTEIGVAVCYTPVGTTTTNDYFEFTGAQLTPNSALASIITASPVLTAPDTRMKSFARKSAAVERGIEYSYYYRINEVSGAYYASGQATATNVESAILNLPVGMRAAPACTVTAGGLSWKDASATLAVSSLTCSAANNQTNIVTLTDAATATAGHSEMLFGTNTTGVIKISARF